MAIMSGSNARLTQEQTIRLVQEILRHSDRLLEQRPSLDEVARQLTEILGFTVKRHFIGDIIQAGVIPDFRRRKATSGQRDILARLERIEHRLAELERRISG